MMGLGTVAGVYALKAFGAEVPAVKRPNILFFFPDQHRYDYTSLNPVLPDVTPNLKQLARDGAYFSLAFCPSPLCAPSRACLALGTEYAKCGVRSNGYSLSLSRTTFYKLLRDSAGYHVMGCGKFDLDKPGRSWGTNGRHEREGEPSLLTVWGFSDGIDNAGKMDGARNAKPEPYKIYKNSVKDNASRDEFYSDNWIARNGLQLLRAVPKGKPWFLQINYNGPHDPFDPTETMLGKWKDARLPPAVGSNKDDIEEKRKYAAEIYNIDHWIAVYKEELRKRGELDNTVIVFSSDHGEMLFDHNYRTKSRPLSPSACVPLVIAGPGIKKGLRYDKAAETLDLVATFLDFAGVPIPSDMDSKSMRRFLEGTGDYPRTHATSALEGWRLVCDRRYKLVAGNLQGKVQAKDENKSEVLYDLQKDPGETVDVLSANPEVAGRLRSLLEKAPQGRASSKGGKKCKKGKE